MATNRRSGINFKRLIAALVLVALAGVLALLLARHMEYRTYKLTYEQEIKKYAAEFNLDPYLVASVIHVESGNRPSVTSSAGATGLMQLMPDTAEWICGKLSLDYDETMLKDPAVNVRLGCWYLRFVKDRFENDQAALAAYNAGHSIVAKWLQDAQYSQDGKALINIPYQQTSDYVVKITNAYEKYKKLYPDRL